MVSLSTFWALWAVAAAGVVSRAPAVLAVGVVPGLAAGYVFYYTLFDVWRERTGLSALGMLFFGGLYPVTSMRAVFTTLRPSWFVPAMRATGWPARRVGAVLGTLLAADLGLAVAMFLTLPVGHSAR